MWPGAKNSQPDSTIQKRFKKPLADYQLEQDILAEADRPDGLVFGVDEAGRGPWAGPVTAAACWLHPDYISALDKGLTDSKKLSPKQRRHFEEQIISGPHRFAVAHATVEEIDRLGILKATFLAMQRAVDQLAAALAAELSSEVAGLPSAILVDGNLTPPFDNIGTALIRPVVKGDSKSLSIAAASVCAKECRDRAMMALDRDYPAYGFAAHKGYGTKQHQEALTQFGPCPAHRTSFKPVARLIQNEA